MIQRDYILRMIQEFVHMIDRLESLVEGEHWDEATRTLDEAFQKLVGAGPVEVSQMSEMALLSRLVSEGPTQAVKDKTLILCRLLKEAGDMAAEGERLGESHTCYLKALHLLLATFGRDEPLEIPEFVPTIEVLMRHLSALPSGLDLKTRAMVMQHYEVSGQYAKALDQLLAMRNAAPDDSALMGFGAQFLDRLQRVDDTKLEDGLLTRESLEKTAREYPGFHAEP